MNLGPHLSVLCSLLPGAAACTLAESDGLVAAGWWMSVYSVWQVWAYLQYGDSDKVPEQGVFITAAANEVSTEWRPDSCDASLPGFTYARSLDRGWQVSSGAEFWLVQVPTEATFQLMLPSYCYLAPLHNKAEEKFSCQIEKTAPLTLCAPAFC